MESSATRNLGLNRKQAEVITVEIEKLLWEQGILSSDNLECLLRMVFYLIGLNYGMRAKTIWFTTMPLGHNKLNSMVKCMTLGKMALIFSLLKIVSLKCCLLKIDWNIY